MLGVGANCWLKFWWVGRIGNRCSYHRTRWNNTTSLALAVLPRWLAYHFLFGTDRHTLPSGVAGIPGSLTSGKPASSIVEMYRGSCQVGSENATICTTHVSRLQTFAIDL